MTEATQAQGAELPVEETPVDDQDEAALWAELEKADAGEPPAETTDEPSVDEEVTAEGDEPPAEGQPEGEPSDATTTAQDPWANATPEQRAVYETAQKEWENRDRRLRGQISALQRQVNELSKAKPAAPAESKKGIRSSERVQKAIEEYPEVAEPLVDAMEEELARRDQEQLTEREKQEQRQHEALIEEQTRLLSDEHPDWQKVTEGTGFRDWLNAQPRHIQEAAYRNADGILDAAEAADVVGRFKQFRQGAQQPPAQGTPTNPPLSGKRQRQLESSSAARARGPGVASGIPADGDPEAIWKHFDEVDRRAARG